jgi:hypothetical protein
MVTGFRRCFVSELLNAWERTSMEVSYAHWLEIEVRRLRRIEQAAREVVRTISAEPFDEDESARAHQALRSALDSP